LHTTGLGPVERLRDQAAGRTRSPRWETAGAAAGQPRARPPLLQHADAAPLPLTAAHSGVPPAGRPALDGGLAALERSQAPRAGMEAVQPPEAGEPEAAFTSLRAGDATHRGGETTVIGRAVLTGGTLRLETNSAHRANTLRGRIEAACRDQLHHRAREHADPQ